MFQAGAQNNLNSNFQSTLLRWKSFQIRITLLLDFPLNYFPIQALKEYQNIQTWSDDAMTAMTTTYDLFYISGTSFHVLD